MVGDMDEDGFYLAKLMNGRSGMVPSNYVERVDGTSDDAQLNETPPGLGGDWGGAVSWEGKGEE